jgi:hypothetical protein
MLYVIIILFALAAVFGILILKNWILSTDTSRTTVYTHGIFAALALVLLVFYFIKNQQDNLKTSFILFVLAAIVGFYMFYKDLKGVFSPTWLGVVHGLVAVAGFIFLLLLVI